ncbi:hypothetical protein H632_c467p0 [Helicosporidium sp. ATCC 50920]|nr:hypothetical protein H632_c467p0 [Helicosporidium sp. ATCC 50920]|eukprot:KDD75857.1 hypothetical protein H632_c467p0 [Helicosporidium sp. ATCC 50920]
MGVISSVVMQLATTVVIIGALKRAGVVKIEEDRINDSTSRMLFIQAVNVGETLVCKGEEIAKDIMGSVRS